MALPRQSPRDVRSIQSERQLRPWQGTDGGPWPEGDRPVIKLTDCDARALAANLDAEAGPASAARGRVGIGDLERRAAKILDKVHPAANDELEADRIDHQRHAVGRRGRVSLFSFP